MVEGYSNASYLIDVPLLGEILAQTQNPIRQNFITINKDLQLIMLAFNESGQGFITKVTFPLQSHHQHLVG